MPDAMATEALFGNLQPFEGLLLARVEQAGTTAARTVVADAQPVPNPTVRGDFLAWLLTTGVALRGPALATLEIVGARVVDPLPLAGVRLTISPRFIGCEFDDVVELTNATIVGLEMICCIVKRIEGDRLNATGQLHLRATYERDPGPIRDRFQSAKSIVTERLRLCGATIRGNLDLRGTIFEGRQIGSQPVIPLYADGVAVGGNALLCDGFHALGEIRLNGCRVERNLDLTGATLSATAGSTRAERVLSFSGAGGRVSGTVYMRSGDYGRFESRGTIRLSGMQIAGEFDCDGGHFMSPNAAKLAASDDELLDFALEADALSVGGDARLGDGLRARGEVHLLNAKFGGDLNCSFGAFRHVESDALTLDGVTVAGTTYLGTRRAEDPTDAETLQACTDGFIRAPYANFKQGLDMRGLTFRVRSAMEGDAKEGGHPKAVCGLDAPFANVGGSFYCQHIRFVGLDPVEARRLVGVSVDLGQAKVDELYDSEDSWKSIRPLRVAGFEYKAVKDLGPDETWRWKKLDEQYGDKAAFQPQPYLWLAKINQQAGNDAAATEVRIRLEENRTRYGDFGWWRRLGRHVLWATIRYGYRPSWAFGWLIGWSLICAALFWDLPNSGALVDAKPTEGAAVATKPTEQEVLRFSPIVYAIDTLVPIVDLHQKSRWVIQPPTLVPWTAAVPLTKAAWQTLLSLIGVINPFIGWALTTLFAAGVSGVVRRGKGEG